MLRLQFDCVSVGESTLRLQTISYLREDVTELGPNNDLEYPIIEAAAKDLNSEVASNTGEKPPEATEKPSD